MSIHRPNWPLRARRLRRDSFFRRLGLEGLERRECPAVVFAFEGGVLRLTGDEAPNLIDISQPRDRVAEVRADGERRTFEGVDAIHVATNGGNDHVHFGKPKEIVVVGSKININVGAGDDLVRISDGESTRPVLLNAAFEAEVDLGTGADRFDMQIRRHDRARLGLTSGDGGDKILTGMLLPAIQKSRAALGQFEMTLGGGDHEVRFKTQRTDQVSLDLAAAGGGNRVQVAGDGYRDVYIDEPLPPSEIALGFSGGDNAVDALFEDSDKVDLSIVSPPPTQPATGGTIPVYWHVINRGSSRQGDDRAELFYAPLPGRGDERTIGVSPSSLSFSATVGTSGGAVVAAALRLGATDDRVQFESRGVAQIDFELSSGAGDDTLEAESFAGRGILRSTDSGSTWSVDLGEGDDLASIRTHGFAASALVVASGAGDDNIKLKSEYVFGVETPRLRTRLDIIAELGDGDDRLDIDAAGYTEVDSFVDAGDGDDRAGTRLFVGGLSFDPQTTQLDAVMLLGAGDDWCEIDTSGYAEAQTLVDGGDGDDSVHVRHRFFALVDRTNLSVSLLLGAGNDTASLLTNYPEVAARIHTGPANNGNDEVLVVFLSGPLSGPVEFLRWVFDGGLDGLSLLAVGPWEIQLLPSTSDARDLGIAASLGPRRT